MAKRYTFDFEYQVDILKICVQDPNFMKSHPDVIEPRFFNLDHLMTVAQILVTFFNKHKEKPEYAIFVEAVAVYFAQFSVRPELQAVVRDLVERIYRELPRNKQAVIDSVCEFAQRQSIARGCGEVLDLLEKGGELGQASDIMRRASVVGMRQREGWNFFHEYPKLSDRLKDDKSYNPKNKIQTGFTKFDWASFGGIGSGQLWVIAAKPKGGKTTLMVNIAAHAIIQRRKVYHYSFGDMNKLDVMIKYVQCFTSLTVPQILVNRNYVSRCDSIIQSVPGAALEIIYESPGVMDNEKLYMDLAFRVAQTGISPDLVVVDYANKMKYPIPESSYRSMSLIYEGLKELGDAFDCGVMTGVQLRRDANKEKGGPEDIAESWLQVADCDAMIIINQSDVEEAAHKARLSMPIIRRGQSVASLEVQFLKAQGRIKAI